MDPTRHITYEETNSKLAIFCSWENQLATLPMKKQILNWPYFILEKKMDPSAHIMKKKFLDWSYYFLEKKIKMDLSCHNMKEKKF
jgi:hypothetical protein